MNEEIVPFGFLEYPNGMKECEESSLCTWTNSQKTQAVPYCFLHKIECSPELMGCYTDSTCGGNVLPFTVATPPPIINLPPEEIVAPTHHEAHPQRVLIILGIIAGLLVVLLFIVVWRVLS